MVLCGLTLASVSFGVESTRVNLAAAPGYSNIASSDDDRGSGRVARQPQFEEWVSFRGSGRVQPEPKSPSFSKVPDSAPYYRGSGRLG